MEKIICDVCGTSYPETSLQCPICGCAKPETGKTAAAGEGAAETGKYTSVKGGRFSSKNVKKRLEASGRVAPPEEPEEEEEETVVAEKPGTSVGMVISVIALILAVCAAVVFIYVRYFEDPDAVDIPEPSETNGIVETTTAAPTETTEPPYISCTGIELDTHSVTLEEEGANWLLHAKALPEDTQDELHFESKDPSVATVSQDGKITAVGNGRTAIVITCGSITAEFEVICKLPVETTVPPTTAPLHQNVRINKTDVTISVGETFELVLKDGKGDIMDVTWEASDAGVVNISGNKITGVKGGYRVDITCTFEGKVYTCVVRVKK